MDTKTITVYYKYTDKINIKLGSVDEFDIDDSGDGGNTVYEKGTNYVKYVNGTLICYGTLEVTSTQVINVYLPTAYNNLNFKIEYKSSNGNVYTTTVNNTRRFAIGVYSTTSGAIKKDTVMWQTTGTWK